MKTINYTIKGYKNKEKEIEDSKKVMIQIFLSTTKEKKIRKIIKLIRKKYKEASIIGSTSDGTIKKDKVKKETIISITEFKEVKLKVIVKEEEDSRRLGIEIRKSTPEESRLLITFMSGLKGNGEEYLKGINEGEKKIIIAGGLSGDNGKFKNTYLIANDRIIKEEEKINAVAISIESKKLKIHQNYFLHWEPIGKEMKITKVNKNQVYEIDGFKADEIYKKYLGEEIADQLPSIGIEFPLIKENNIARAVIRKGEDGSLIFAGNFEEGEKVRFGYGDINNIIEKTSRSIEEDYKGKSIETIFIYSCMARRRLLKKEENKELKKLSEIKEVSGFYTYGEFSSDLFLNESMTILVLSETEEKKEIIFKENKKNKNINLVKGLTNLISVSMKELEIQNKIIISENKFKSIEETINNLSHQWKQPLTGISLLVQTIKVMYLKGKLNEDFLNKRIETTKEEINKMLENLEKVKKTIKHGEIEKNIDIRKTIEDILWIKEEKINNNEVKIIKEIEDFTINIIEENFRRNIIEIINNSIESLNKKNNENKKIIIRTINKENENIIEIEDNGEGVKEEELEKIFNPYYTTKHQTINKGLNLYIIKKELENQGIKIKAITKEKKFIIKIIIPKIKKEEIEIF
jgi:signal transduction histidine kinase